MPTALVVGASSGIGRALAQRLLARDWTVIGVARRTPELTHDRYRHVIADVRAAEFRATLVDAIATAVPDVCIYTAGITPGGVPALLAFVVGPPAIGWAARDLGARRAEVVATLVAEFGEAAATPIDYVDVDWGADPWSAGCVATLPPGVLSAGARWREPHGRIHLAGTEAAARWPGYMEGAIEAGERAADEVLEALSCGAGSGR